ncbi:hypothetical protein LWI29_019870 [Acer saccharum]|uniref:Uncharacterized protein n=1 Tax=Acer saccharum TaxID=4024 RepID=A0AA39RKD3_ACESA|nr:hypothetical protein LWI29_019870 [Acer saccharum]
MKYTSPVETTSSESFTGSFSNPPKIGNGHAVPSDIDLDYLREHVEVEDESSTGYQELLLWRQKSSYSRNFSEDVANDKVSIGLSYLDCCRNFLLTLKCLSKHALKNENDWTRRPSTKNLLESPYFPSIVKTSYLLVAPLQLIAKDGSRLRYAANFVKQGSLKAMGSFAAEMCAPYCLSLVVTPLSDTEVEWAYILLKEFIKCLTPKGVIKMILPAIQKILQATGYSHLKVSLLQDSSVREIWNRTGKQAYLETIHPLVISNLYVAPHKSSASAASVLLICSSEELGVPITVHQTILPLIQCFGRGICPDGIDVLVRIGGLLGETCIVTQMLPLLKHVTQSCIDVLSMNKSEPVQSWSALSLIDCLMTLEGLVAFLPREVVIKELTEDQSCLHVMVLMQTNLAFIVLQLSHRKLPMGLVLRAEALRLPNQKLMGSLKLKVGWIKWCHFILLLHLCFRQGCATWLLLEQFLLRCHNWKWEQTGDSSRTGTENITAKRPLMSKGSTSDYSPAKLLLNGVGWSIPQSQGNRSAKNLIPHKWVRDVHQSHVERHESTSNLMKCEPWSWFPNTAVNWDGPDFLGHVGGLKDEIPWKIRASVISSVHAHHGALRSLVVCQDECTVFIAGVGPGFKGTVQKWVLTRINNVSGYYGHEEVHTFDGSDKMQARGAPASPSWIAAVLSSGQCRLFDVRSGNVIASWKAHDGYVTKLAAPEDHLLLSSSLDKIGHHNPLFSKVIQMGYLVSLCGARMLFRFPEIRLDFPLYLKLWMKMVSIGLYLKNSTWRIKERETCQCCRV